jgi:hypothetical protein
MRTLRVWLVRIAGILQRTRRERELAAEIESHLQLHIDDNLRAGMSPDEARRAALVRFGAVEAVKAEYRDRSRVRVLDGVVSDVRHAVRRLRAAPAFTLFAIVSLALGIGATTAIYSTVHTLLWRPAGIAEPEHVVNLVRAGAPAAARSAISRPDFRDFSSQQTSFSGLAASEPFQAAG